MIKYILQVREFVVLELKLNELSGRRNLEVSTRSELVGKPEFSVRHFGRERLERLKKSESGKAREG